MITLITGAPGSGKTLYCVDKIIRPMIGTRVAGTDENGDATIYERRVYSNINGLLIDHELVDAAWLENLADNKQPGAFVVFDEVQRVWPNRPTGSKKPAAVEYLETHRHDGIDVVLMTQSPQLLDPAVRKLVGRHLHMRRVGSIGAAVVYEWDACSDTLRFKSAFTKTPYRYSRSAQRLYKSARVHTKQKRRLPFAVWMLFGGVAAAAYMWPHVFGRLTSERPVSQAVAASKAAAASAPGAALSSPGSKHVLSPLEYRDSFRARWQGLPHTAPRYDDLTKPTRVPYPAACITNKSRGCVCYSQDGSRMYLPQGTCSKIIDEGIFLDFEPDAKAHSGKVLTSGAVTWSTKGALLAGGQPSMNHVPGTEREQITPGDIAKASTATTGRNIYARDAVKVADAPTPGSPRP